MAELKRLFESLGFRDVSTFIASGNVVFSASAAGDARLEAQIEAGLLKKLGYTVETMVRSVPEVSAIAAHVPFPGVSGPGSTYVGMLKSALPADAVKRLLALQTDVDSLTVHGREVYWLARRNQTGTTIPATAMGRALQTPVTFRNMNTMQRLAVKYGS